MIVCNTTINKTFNIEENDLPNYNAWSKLDAFVNGDPKNKLWYKIKKQLH